MDFPGNKKGRWKAVNRLIAMEIGIKKVPTVV
jgi:hypothetical protein